MRGERESNIEFLRLIACIGVIVIHIRPVPVTSDGVDRNALVIAAVTATDSVAVFFAITGCFWFSHQNGWAKTTWKFIRTIFIPSSAIALMIMVFTPYIFSHSIWPSVIKPDITKYLAGFLTRDCYYYWGEACGPYWYVFEFAGLVFLYPLLRAVCDGRHDRTAMFIVLASIILMALSDATAFLPDRSYDIQIYHILPMAAVEVLIGYLMYRYRDKYQGRRWATGALVGFIALVMLRYILQDALFEIDSSNSSFIAYDHCLAPVVTIFLFVIFLNIHIRYCYVINKLASYTFYIYLIHYAVRIKLFQLGVFSELLKILNMYFSKLLLIDLIYTFVATAIIFIISLLFAFIIKTIEEAISRIIKKLAFQLKSWKSSVEKRSI